MYQLIIPGTVLFSLLVGGFVIYRLRSRSMRARLLFGLLASSAMFLCIWLAVVGVLLAALFEPWPLSMRQGPDTDFAHQCFERYLQGAPSASFTNIYCRDEWGFGGDSIRSIRFDFAERAPIETLVDRLRLARTQDSARPGFRYLRGPAWWPQQAELRALPEAYVTGDREYLWLDPVARVAYFQVAGF